MLNTVVENLLDHAWKFTSRHPAATIEFGAIESNGRTVYFVRDDGAGFDMRFADKLFMPFHRFHSSGEFPGLGMSLAIVHSIARHNGRIWAESAQEKSTTFFFTL
jgi:light-regulated signal transduction histidine kinase (bacteriophytochrome)